MFFTSLTSFSPTVTCTSKLYSDATLFGSSLLILLQLDPHIFFQRTFGLQTFHCDRFFDAAHLIRKQFAQSLYLWAAYGSALPTDHQSSFPTLRTLLWSQIGNGLQNLAQNQRCVCQFSFPFHARTDAESSTARLL